MPAINNAIEDSHNRLEQFQRRKTANQKSADRAPSEMDFKDQLGFTAPIMIPDSDVSMCQVCPKSLHQSFILEFNVYCLRPRLYNSMKG